MENNVNDCETADLKQSIQKQYKKNTVLFLIYYIISNSVLLFSTGAFFQEFLNKFGLNPEKIGIITSAYSIMQIVPMLFGIFKLDGIKDIKKFFAYFALPQMVFYACMAMFCLFSDLNTKIIFYISLIVVLILGISLGMMNIISYKIPYLLIDMKKFGNLLSVCVALVGAVGIIVSMVVKSAFNFFKYKSVMLISYTMCVIFLLIEFIIIMRMKNVNTEIEKQDKKANFLDVFRSKAFRVFVIPDFIRGLAAGVYSLIPTMLQNDFGKKSDMAVLVIITNIAYLVSSTILSIIVGKIKKNILCLITTLLSSIFWVFLGITNNWTVFIICYFLFFSGYNTFGTVLPIYVAEIVPYNIIGGYTSIRMILMMAGTALGSFVCGFLITRVSSLSIYITAATLSLIVGLVYGLYPMISKWFKGGAEQ